MDPNPKHQADALFANVSVEPIRSLMNVDVVVCRPETIVADVAETMALRQCGSIIIADGGGHPVGIWTESDALGLELDEPGVFDEPISRFMSSPLITIDEDTTLQSAAIKFREHGIRHLVVVNAAGIMTGLVSQTDVVLKLGIHFYLSLRQVGSIVFRTAFALPHDLRVAEAVSRLRSSTSDGALVTENGNPIGIITERDVVKLVAQRAHGVAVGEVCSKPLVTMPVDAPLLAARDLLDSRKLRHLVVTGRSGELLGLLSMADILAAMEHGYVRHLEEVLDASNRQLAEAERRLSLILRSAGEGVVGLDAAGRVTFVNVAAAKLTGWADADMVGREWHELIRHAITGNIPCPGQGCAMMAPCGGAGETRLDAHYFTRRDGSAFPVEVVASPLAEGDRHVGAVLVFRDISQRLAAQRAVGEREELYRQMFERNAAVKLLIDPNDGAIVDANQAAVRFYGHSKTALTGLTLREIDTAPMEKVTSGLADARDERVLFCRSRHRLASGAIRDVEVHSGPIGVNGRNYIHSIVTDVTDRNRFQADLETRTEQLRRSNADLQQFAYVASHDLQEPLRMVTSYLDLIKLRYADVFDEEGLEFIGYAIGGSRRMRQLIRDLLEYSRVDSRGQDFKDVSLENVIGAALANLSMAVADAGAAIVLPKFMPHVTGDEGQLVRLLQNLIGNALKYRHADRPLRVLIGVERAGNRWVVSVTDNGIGIDSRYFDRIFLIFQRLHAPGEYDGSGIGLAVCKRIVERHDGKIWVESTVGQGSKFALTLPALSP